jgi:hypothetical protein
MQNENSIQAECTIHEEGNRVEQHIAHLKDNSVNQGNIENKSNGSHLDCVLFYILHISH